MTNQEFNVEKVKNGLLYSNFIYTTEDEKVDDFKKDFPENCEIFLYSDHFDETNLYEYRCAVIIDPINKTVNLANAGTRPSLNSKGAYDLFDDARLTLGYLPKKLEPASKLNDIILHNIEALGGNLKEWNFNYTGHSLGAVMANVGAADMAIKLKEKGALQEGMVSSLGFDNPGAKNLVDCIYKNANLSSDQAIKDVKYVNINNSKNFINTTNEQIGETFELLPNGLKEKNPLYKFVDYLTQKLSFLLPPFMKKLFQIISYGNITTQLDSHKLNDFVNVINKEKGDIKIDGVVTNLESAIKKDYVIPYDKKLVDFIKDRRKIETKPREMNFMMKDDQGHNFLLNKSEILAAKKSGINIPDSIISKTNIEKDIRASIFK
jgi:hypothetical protein